MGSFPDLRPRPKLYAALGLVFAVVTWSLMSTWPLSLQLLRFYPKRAGSAVVGWAANRTLPRSMRGSLLGGFARKFGMNLQEADRPIEQYLSLQDLFTRRLKSGLRPQDSPSPGSVNSPVDARIIASGRIEAGMAIQAKGLPYSIAELLKLDPIAARFEGGHFLTLYLAPKDYHRIHVPIEGQVTAVSHIEGELWPVNDASTGHVPRLYERNRRATWTATGTGPDAGLEVAAVLVGATHVGGVIIDDRWLGGRTLPKLGGFSVPNLGCLPGDDLGTFAFGSTVVLLIGGAEAAKWQAIRTSGDVRVGQRLGAFR